MVRSSVGSSEYSLDEYYRKESISKEHQEKINEADILIMPYEYNNDFYFADETKSFYKYCRNKDYKQSIDILTDDIIKVRSLNSFDIWMPLLYIAKDILLPIAINIICDYINEKLKNRRKDSCNIEVTLKVQCDNKVKEIHYKGDAKLFEKKFKKIDINNL